ncbi:nitronate monooxygenase [Halomonas sp. MCCC 1A11036]|uniref:Propionate 3-nitronate monooxygenase n=1 Tax=Billgrantia zhangzhouensis TaxID=2733481 RepID=A0ABS9ALH3_9GAMM|nr:nitronate monooxygenase [Halomonas zhangzhouensis]MCE8022448.1 nitronate monooxygenase [Halomonas zhangzhouensis]
MSLTHQLGIEFPILQAPMAGVQGGDLAVAVCEAGGLGALPCAMLSPEAMVDELQRIRAATAKPLNVNFFCHVPPAPDEVRLQRWHQALAPYYAEYGLDIDSIAAGAGRRPFDHKACDALAAFRPEVVSFHFGLPEPALVERVKAWGAVVLSSATTVEEACWLEAHGVDVVIAQGAEAGGHRGMFLSEDVTTQLGTFALLPQVVEAVSVPVVAAGGIADSRGVAAALALGASAVQVGTAFLCCPEAMTSTLHRQALLSEAARHTALTNLYTGRPARGILTRLMRELGPLSDVAPAFPLATSAIAPLRSAAESAGSTDFSPLWAGQNASACREIPAADVVRALTAGLR